MVINCNDDGVLLTEEGLEIKIDEKNLEKIIQKYQASFRHSEVQSDKIDKITIMKKIYSIVETYINKYPVGKVVGAEYVSVELEKENKDLIMDIINLFSDILEFYARNV